MQIVIVADSGQVMLVTLAINKIVFFVSDYKKSFRDYESYYIFIKDYEDIFIKTCSNKIF